MQFKFTKFATAFIASGIISLPLIAHANDSSELEELRALVQQLDQKVKILARNGELAEEKAAVRTAAVAAVAADAAVAAAVAAAAAAAAAAGGQG